MIYPRDMASVMLPGRAAGRSTFAEETSCHLQLTDCIFFRTAEYRKHNNDDYNDAQRKELALNVADGIIESRIKSGHYKSVTG
jgi:hypothetical protein